MFKPPFPVGFRGVSQCTICWNGLQAAVKPLWSESSFSYLSSAYPGAFALAERGDVGAFALVDWDSFLFYMIHKKACPQLPASLSFLMVKAYLHEVSGRL